MTNEGTDLFLQSPELKEWSASKQAEILWYAGPPGSKKTERVLSLVQVLKDGSHGSVQGRVAFFFSYSRARRSSWNQRLTSTTIGLAILAQLLDHDILKNIPEDLQKRLYAECPASDNTEHKSKGGLWEILAFVVQHILLNEVDELCIIIDGIGEMLTLERGTLLQELRALWETTANCDAKAHRRLKILIVSRPYSLDVLSGLPFTNPDKEALGESHKAYVRRLSGLLMSA
jgi:hypothetical protein